MVEDVGTVGARVGVVKVCPSAIEVMTRGRGGGRTFGIGVADDDFAPGGRVSHAARAFFSLVEPVGGLH